MATITATNASNVVSARHIIPGMFSITAGPFSHSALTVGDVVQMMKVPNGFNLKELTLLVSSQPLSAGGNVTTAFQVGDGNSAARFLSAISVSATAYYRLNAGIPPTINYRYTADDTIDVTVGASTLTDSASKSITLTLIAMGAIDD